MLCFMFRCVLCNAVFVIFVTLCYMIFTLQYFSDRPTVNESNFP